MAGVRRTAPVRITPDLERAVRQGPYADTLAGLDLAVLIRAGLALLAGHPLADAVSAARMKPGPKPRPREDART